VRIDSPTRRLPRETVVPMINVGFLLLIFFLMVAVIVPPPPFEITPPQSETKQPAELNSPLYLSASGELAWAEARGEAVFDGLASVAGPESQQPLTLVADGQAKGAEVARLLSRLAGLGFARVELAVMP